MEKLANIAELEPVQISRIELGKTNPKLSTLFVLANALQVPLQKIISYTDFLQKIQGMNSRDFKDVDWPAELTTGSYAELGKKTTAGVYVLDYTVRNYLYIDEKTAAFGNRTIAQIMDGGLDFVFKTWHPNDFQVYDKFILPDNIAFLETIDPAKTREYLFTCNYRIRHTSGHYVHLEQQSFFENFSTDGVPLLTIGFLRDITHRISNNNIFHTIEHFTPVGNERVLKKVYSAEEMKRIE